MPKFSGPRGRFIHIARWEGTSYLLLLFIAMPLKYGFGWGYAVTYVGWVHGLLFAAYGLALVQIWVQERWSFGRAFLAGLVSLLPFGTFWFEKKYLKA